MRKLFLTVLLAVSAVVLQAQTSIQVQTHNVVAADEHFNVTFIIEGEGKITDFNWAPGEDFQLLWGPQQGRSSSVQIINGKTTKSVQTTYSYLLRPQKPGKFTIPTATAKVKGNEITSRPVTIEVVASGASSQQPAQQQSQQSKPRQSAGVGDNDIFLTLNLSRTNVVVGEPITATIKLWQRVNIAGFESAEFPDFDGFWSQEIEAPNNIEFTREAYEGQIYNSALLRKFVLIPQQQGSVTISPAELVCLVNVRVSSGGNSIFDGFFDDYTTIRKKVVSKPVTVRVSPLPAGAPASFGGGVGKFSMSARISKDSLKTHEAASFIVTVSGTGNISLLDAPKVVLPPDMELYDTKVSEKIDKGGRSGSKTYEYPFIPRSYGDFTIDPVKYSYYDIDAGKYVTLETPPISLHIAKGKDAENVGTVVSSINQKDVRSLGSDIRFINTKAPELAAKGYFFVGSALFWIIAAVLLIAAVACWAGLRKLSARRADVVGTKNRKAVKMAMKRLHLAGTFLKQNLYTAFYEELHKALLGFISDKLNFPMAELSKENIAEAMKKGGVEERHIDAFISLLDACEFARYSPSAGYDAMSAHYNAAVDVISSIGSNMKTTKKSSGNTVLMLAVLMALPTFAQAQDAYVDSLWNSANQAYSEGRWADAAEGYSLISDASLESAALWCNLGDAWYKDGNIPKAILCYERALKVDPSYGDARFNLDFLNSQIQDRIEPVPELILKTWMRKISYMLDSDAWAVCFLVLFGLTLAMVLLFLLAPSLSGRRAGFFTALATLLLSIGALSFSIWQKSEYTKADAAIVMRPVSSVKSSPSYEAAKDLFVLHEGTKVKVIDSVGSWNNIELADGRQGWIPSSDIEII